MRGILVCLRDGVFTFPCVPVILTPLDTTIAARRLDPEEKVQLGDWYLIPFAPTFFQVKDDMVGKSWLENNAEWFRFLGFYRI